VNANTSAHSEQVQASAPAAAAAAAAATATPGDAKPLWRSLIEIAIALGIVVVLANMVFASVEIRDDSMSPTLRPGQRVLVSRLPYLLAPPQRGDIVIVRNRIDPSAWETRRVIGGPGDRLDIKGAQVSVNGQPLKEPYQPENLERVGVNPLTTGQYQLVEDQYFLMNDNRADLDDSRSYGASSADDIVGRAWLVMWPLENVAAVQHARPAPREP
jgi:signal peptidase I